MKKIIIMCLLMFLSIAQTTKAQFVVTDPTNLASGILNSANEIIQTSGNVVVEQNFKN